MLKIKVPNMIKIGAYYYQVSTVTQKDFMGKRSDGADLVGMISTRESTIEILDALSEQVKPEVLFHEVIHGILYNAGIMGHDEIQVDAIAHGILAVLLENPGLLVESE